jgi:hypothetical protein
MVNTAMVDVQAEIDGTLPANSLYDKDSSMMSQFDKGNLTLVDPSLPDSVDSSSVEEDSGNLFTDMWKSLTSAFTNKLGWVLDITNSIPMFFTKIGLPVAFVFAIGFVWHTLFLFLLILVLTGRGS